MKQRSISPDSAMLIDVAKAAHVNTVWERYDAQQPQCGFGLRGLCCRMCQWGPCRISAKSPKGVCGRTMELVVMANLLRAVAAGTSAQIIHAHEMILTLRAAVRDEITLPITRQPSRSRWLPG